MNTLNGKKILVVDDEALIREVFSLLLTSQGFNVETAANGHLALDKIKESHYDIILSDVRMPECDGIKFLKLLPDKVKSQTKIFMCTGFDDISHQDAKNLGILKVFPKPFEFSTISHELKSALI